MRKKEDIRGNSMPFSEGLFTLEGEKAFLVGSKCPACGQIYFPAQTICFECEDETMETFKFGNKGTLYSYAVSHMPSAHFEAPYVAGWIQVSEGIRVFAPLKSMEGRPLRIGTDVVLTIGELWRNGASRVMGYAYEIR